MPSTLSNMYQATKAPTVAKPTYVPISIHLQPQHRRFKPLGFQIQNSERLRI